MSNDIIHILTDKGSSTHDFGTHSKAATFLRKFTPPTWQASRITKMSSCQVKDLD